MYCFRLIKYDPATKTNTVLLGKIHLANGLALSKDGSFLVISETVAHRLLKYVLVLILLIIFTIE